MKKEIIEIIRKSFEKPPPEIVAAQNLLKLGYTENDLTGLEKEMDYAWLLKTRNALRDLNRN